MKRRSFLRLGAGTALGGALAACGGGGGASAEQAPQYKAVVGWTQTALQAVRSARPGPPMAARSFAIMYTCMYNAWCAFDALAQPTRPASVPRRPPAERTAANKAMAMSFAAYAALLDQFTGEKAALDAAMKSLGDDAALASTDPGMPPGLGTAVARAELDYCRTDGANQLGDLAPGGLAYADYTGYVARNPPMAVGEPTPLDLIPAPGNWQPLTYTDAAGVVRTPAFMAAAWERVKPFALASSDQNRPGPPAAYGSAELPYQLPTFPTPPFPEHVSGHSSFSAAAAEVLESFTGGAAFGARYTKVAHSMVLEPGLPASELSLSWATFRAAAEQAGLSRIYGGIHFDNGNTAGQTLGRRTGALAFAKAQALWLGKSF